MKLSAKNYCNTLKTNIRYLPLFATTALNQNKNAKKKPTRKLTFSYTNFPAAIFILILMQGCTESIYNPVVSHTPGVRDKGQVELAAYRYYDLVNNQGLGIQTAYGTTSNTVIGLSAQGVQNPTFVDLHNKSGFKFTNPDLTNVSKSFELSYGYHNALSHDLRYYLIGSVGYTNIRIKHKKENDKLPAWVQPYTTLSFSPNISLFSEGLIGNTQLTLVTKFSAFTYHKSDRISPVNVPASYPQLLYSFEPAVVIKHGQGAFQLFCTAGRVFQSATIDDINKRYLLSLGFSVLIK